MRSPMAEAVLRQLAADARDTTLVVCSAGLRAIRGRPADPRASTVAARMGWRLDEHRAQPLTRALVDEATVIFVMDWRNEAELVARFPDAERKVLLLGAFGPQGAPGAPAIPDPYLGDIETVETCYAQLVPAVRAVAERFGPSRRRSAVATD